MESGANGLADDRACMLQMGSNTPSRNGDVQAAESRKCGITLLVQICSPSHCSASHTVTSIDLAFSGTRADKDWNQQSNITVE